MRPSECELGFHRVVARLDRQCETQTSEDRTHPPILGHSRCYDILETLVASKGFLREETTVRFPLNKHRADIEEALTMMSNIAALLHTHNYQSDVVPLCL